MSNAIKNFDILASLSALHNYFDSSTKLLTAKISDLLAKPFFPFRYIFFEPSVHFVQIIFCFAKKNYILLDVNCNSSYNPILIE